MISLFKLFQENILLKYSYTNWRETFLENSDTSFIKLWWVLIPSFGIAWAMSYTSKRIQLFFYSILLGIFLLLIVT